MLKWGGEPGKFPARGEEERRLKSRRRSPHKGVGVKNVRGDELRKADTRKSGQGRLLVRQVENELEFKKKGKLEKSPREISQRVCTYHFLPRKKEMGVQEGCENLNLDSRRAWGSVLGDQQ